MHQLAQRFRTSYPNQQSMAVETRLVLILANSLDCEIHTEQISRHRSFSVLAATSDLDYGLARSERINPHVLVLDPKISRDAMERATELTQIERIANLLILDDRLHEGRLSELLKIPSVSYLTRQSGLDTLLSSILRIAQTGNRIFDPAVTGRIHKTSRGLRLDRPTDQPSVALLTARELEVMKLLANGYSVKRCAGSLQLAESTIDNHKSRLMKKLDVHKIVELTHVAIREGLIVV